MKDMTMSICDINLTSRSWDWTNQTLKPDWFGDIKPFYIKNEYISLYIRRSDIIGRSETGQ